MARTISFISSIITFLVSLISAYLFSINKINFENLIWIVIGLIVFLGIMIYQEIKDELEGHKWEQKRLDEKLKIYNRLNKIEEKLK